MNIKFIKLVLPSFLLVSFALLLNSCGDAAKEGEESQETAEITYPSDVIPFFDKFRLVLGNGDNAGDVTGKEFEGFFYTEKEGDTDWVVYKTPNAGNTHGTSNNTRTELAQAKKWHPTTKGAKMTATLKVKSVSNTGDARVAASYSVVVGQIHSADGHENEPLKIYYKKFPGHTKGSVFWNYEINTAGEDNSGRWDYSLPIWGDDFATVGETPDTYPAEPEDGIELGEEFSYEIEVKDGMMYLKFTSEGHDTKTFEKNLVESIYTKKSDMPEQVQKLFVPIGQDGVERATAYTGEGLFFKQGCYNQTNGKDPKDNMVWCNGAETHGGDIQKQYETGNYAEVWFKTSEVTISDDAFSNEEYFTKNDHLQQRQQSEKK